MTDTQIFLVVLVTAVPLVLLASRLYFGVGLTSRVVVYQLVPMAFNVAGTFYWGSEGITVVTFFVVLIPGLILLFWSFFAFQNLIVKPVIDQAAALERVVDDKDLTQALVVSDRSDEVGALSRACNTLVATLRESMADMGAGASGVKAASGDLLSAAGRASSTAAEQASTVTQVGATIEEINRTSEAAATSAGEVVHVAEDALTRGQQGLKTVAEAVDTIERVRSRVADVANSITELSALHRRIGDIVDVVRELSDQSNLLAVNASIEAAKAGEHGRGFSVVADEVRRLAEQSKGAMREVRELLETINASSGAAVQAAVNCKEEALHGRRSVDSVRGVIEALAGVLEDSAVKARSIQGATRQQASGVAQIAQAMEAVAQGGRDSAEAATDLQDAVTSLNDLSDTLSARAATFKV